MEPTRGEEGAGRSPRGSFIGIGEGQIQMWDNRWCGSRMKVDKLRKSFNGDQQSDIDLVGMGEMRE